MQYDNLAEKVRVDGLSRTTLIDSNVALVRANQLAAGQQACFRSEQRLLCKDEKCEWRRGCHRLVAVWLR